MSIINSSSLFSNQAYRASRRSVQNMSQAIKLLSTGQKQEASNIAIGNSLSRQSAASNLGAANGMSSIARADVASSALNQMDDIMGRMNTLASRATDSTLNAGDRGALNSEASMLQSELSEIVANSSYNGSPVLQGGSTSAHLGDPINIQNADGNNVIAALGAIDLSSAGSTQSALTQIDQAHTALATEQVKASTAAASLSRASTFAMEKAANLDGAAAQISGADAAMSMAQFVASSIQNQVASQTLNHLHQVKSDEIKTLLEA